MYREETIRDLDDIRIRYENKELNKYQKQQHVVMILNEFITNIGFDDVAEALCRCSDEL
jgi:hypothetical protein|tara:strand:+ start:378 stop:554 length:177 start_codon:yes stop_codon:yes gene_type:complete